MLDVGDTRRNQQRALRISKRAGRHEGSGSQANVSKRRESSAMPKMADRSNRMKTQKITELASHKSQGILTRELLWIHGSEQKNSRRNQRGKARDSHIYTSLSRSFPVMTLGLGSQ